MNKRHFAIIGHPANHSMSPFLQNKLFNILNIDAEYSILDIPPHSLELNINKLKQLDGFNITIPYKTEILHYIDSLDKKSQLYGSVNTVKVDKATRNFTGYNTDGVGFLKALEYKGIKLKGRVVILGCGGAARAIAYESVMAGCETIIAVRPSGLRKVAKLVSEIKDKTFSPQISTCIIDRLECMIGGIDLLVNATPVGMHPNYDEMIVNDIVLSRCAAVFDAVYNPMDTALIKRAKKRGISVIEGIYMLIWQGIAANQIWTGANYDKSDIDRLCIDTIQEMKNIFGEK